MDARDWKEEFSDRDKRLISNCIAYAHGDPAGVPGHNLMLIIAKMASVLEQQGIEVQRLEEQLDYFLSYAWPEVRE